MTTSCHLCGGRHWSIDCPQRDELTAGGFVNEIHSLRAALAEREARITELERVLRDARVDHLPTCGGAGPRCFCGADEHNAPIAAALSRKGTP